MIEFNEIQDGNDKICLFCGAELSSDGTKWIFDKPGVDKIFMKCPPWGFIPRSTNSAALLETRIMRFHESWDWLMIAIKECSKKLINSNLNQKYDFIIQELTNFSYVGNSNILIIHKLVVDFIDEYNNLISLANTK